MSEWRAEEGKKTMLTRVVWPTRCTYKRCRRFCRLGTRSWRRFRIAVKVRRVG